MYLETKHLHSRQLFRFMRFASGETWRSPSTGKELTIVRSRWDSETPALHGPTFAHEYYRGSPLSRVYPELRDVFGEQPFAAARLVSDDGWCRPENQVICFPIEGEKAVFGVDLVGYGPTEWLPDGISGQECVERKIEPWSVVARWPRPERMVSIASLQYGWAIRSEQFARATRRMGEKSDMILTLYANQEKILDAARGEALYVVSSIVPYEDIEWDSGRDDYSGLDIRLCRLRPDRTYDPCGEIIELRQHSHQRNATRNSPFQPVEFVGVMSFDGETGVISCPPRPLHF